MQPALALADGGRRVTLHAFPVQIDLLFLSIQIDETGFFVFGVEA